LTKLSKNLSYPAKVDLIGPKGQRYMYFTAVNYWYSNDDHCMQACMQFLNI